MPTDDLFNKHRSRVLTESKWGDKAMKASLNSNSLQISPTIKANKDKEKETTQKRKGNNGGNNSGNNKNGQKKPNETGANDQNAKKPKKEGTCSLCGVSCGHTDLTCFSSHTTTDAKAKIEENRRNPEMKRHFRQLDHAARKRSGQSEKST